MRQRPFTSQLFVVLALITWLVGCGGQPDAGADGGTGGSAGTGGSGGVGTGGSGGGGKGEPCTPTTCAAEGAECGWIFDGCGEILDCGGCPEGGECGRHQANRCGACEPRTCADVAEQGKTACGLHDDGCGGTLDCGGCPQGQVCGDGTRNLCVEGSEGGDIGVICKTREEACAGEGVECGPVGDGCGGLIDCGTCTAPDTCGGAGVPGQCGQPPACVPKTCAELGYECGMAVDNCGNAIDCGSLTCPEGEVCGGDGANRCGKGGSGNQDRCDDQEVTTLSGVVRTPRGANGEPLYGALVYIPKTEAEIPPLEDGISCQRCEDQVPPIAIAHAITGPDGAFTLTNIPSGDVPLVIQIGKWRRKIDVEVTPCVDNVLSGDQTRLPRRHHEDSVYDNIPMIAVSTGQVDGLECVLRKMGVDDSQFSDPWGPGRIHFYRGSRSAGATYSSQTPSESELVGDLQTLQTYDAVLLGCQAGETTRDPADVQRLVQYADAGGRIFATHFSRDWLRYEQPFAGTAQWSGSGQGHNSAVGRVDESFQKGQDFAAWLRNVGAGSLSGGHTQLTIQEARLSVNAVQTAQRWIYLPQSDHVQHMTFNTPVEAPPAQQCGRVVFSDFHVTTGTHSGRTFPSHCGSSNLTAQEKVLAFMLFDLASCIQDDVPPPPTCTPRTCADGGRECGLYGDGCGGLLECGTCPQGQTCGGGGVQGQCGETLCEPQTCADLGVECGPVGDGCGGVIECGTCPDGMLCGVGAPGICGEPVCTPKSCEDLGVSCGILGDGCGGVVDCGCCPGDCEDDPQ